MSKKKTGGSTMTLKDFHGGSIPSDLPLPSAPGVVPRSADRPSYDRASWANPVGRPDQRNRPISSPSIRHFDDKTPFLSQASNIGRNFDEDERKPLDGSSAPRRTVSDDSFRRPETRLELRQSFLGGRVPGWQGTSLAGGIGGSYFGKVSEIHAEINSHNAGISAGSSGPGAYPNVWALRKEVTVGPSDSVQSFGSVQTPFSKLANASALEKVSSGRWQSKPHYQADIEIIDQSEPETGFHSKNCDEKNSLPHVGWGRDYSGTTLARHVERGLIIKEGVHSRKKSPISEGPPASSNSEANERNVGITTDEFRPTLSDGKFGGPERQPTVPYEAERPKLKLLPRTKPLEHVEKPVKDTKQDQIGTGNGMHKNLNPAKPVLYGNESVDQPLERPKLNLKPRSQALEPSDTNLERDRNAVFGGGRPRELVLRERGVDDVAISAYDSVQPVDRVSHAVPKTERVLEQPMLSRHGERLEIAPHDQKSGKKFEKKDNRGDVDRMETQRRSWRNENRKNGKEGERKPQAQEERHPSPETWRKPIEQPKAASPDGTGLRLGKAASAMELAQAFAKPFSDPRGDGRPPHRSIPGQMQLPFSRLTSPAPRHINGY